jgi:hypothetical protein
MELHSADSLQPTGHAEMDTEGVKALDTEGVKAL